MLHHSVSQALPCLSALFCSAACTSNTDGQLEFDVQGCQNSTNHELYNHRRHRCCLLLTSAGQPADRVGGEPCLTHSQRQRLTALHERTLLNTVPWQERKACQWPLVAALQSALWLHAPGKQSRAVPAKVHGDKKVLHPCRP